MSKLLQSKNLPRILILTSIIAYLFSLRIVTSDPYFHFRWVSFALHMISLGAIFFLYLLQSLSKIHFKKVFTEKELNPFIIIVFVTIVANFLLLSFYPYVSIADELRDGGLFTMKIASGVITNIFGYGSYDAHGLIIPTLTVPFYFLFGNSTLTYRFPAALLSTTDVLFLYLLIRLMINRSTAFWSALVLATLPLHMFFAHTQVVVAYNFFWVPIILLALVTLLKRHRLIDYLFFGTLLGFACGFHAAIRAFASVIFLLFLFLEFKELIIKKFTLDESLILRFTKILLLIGFLFIGFGPRLLFTGPQDFFHSSRFIFENKLQTSTPITLQNLTTIKNNYMRSLMVYIYEPTAFFYPDVEPILSPFLAVFFVLGIGYAFFILKNQFFTILLFLLIVLPFFTSAITDLINASHRVSPLFAIASVFVGLGITYCLRSIRHTKWRRIFIVIMLCYFVIQVVTFYTKQPANLTVRMPGYINMHALYFLQHDKQNPVCLYVSPANYIYYMRNYEAYYEQQQFLVPNTTINYGENNSIKNNEVYIVNNDCLPGIPYTKLPHTYTISCSKGNNYTCPITYFGNIVIHY